MAKIVTKLLTAALLTVAGCSAPALRPGTSDFQSGSGFHLRVKQSENPKAPSVQNYDAITVTEIPQPSGPPVKITKTEHAGATIGAAQKDVAREFAAKLSSFKGIMWLGVAVFLFGAVSAFYPPLKLVIGSVTTSAIIALAGLVLIVLPTLVVGNEILIMSVALGGAVLYFFAHRHASVHAELKTLKK